MLAVEELGVRFGSRWIFRGLSFKVEAGQILAVLGRNGSGKSTLLRAIAGLQQVSEGSVGLPAGDPRLILGYAALEMSLYNELTVGEHLQFTADLRGCESRTSELLKSVNLNYAEKVQAQHLSTGMKIRLKLALALQPRPPVLLLDEPSASLDEEGRSILSSICRDQSTHGCVVIATNDPMERQVATHELVLSE